MFNLKKMFKFWKYLDFWKKIKIPDLKKSIPNNKRKSVSVVWYGLVRREITSVRSCNRVRPSAVVCSVVCYRYVRLTSARLISTANGREGPCPTKILYRPWAPWPNQITCIWYKRIRKQYVRCKFIFRLGLPRQQIPSTWKKKQFTGDIVTSPVVPSASNRKNWAAILYPYVGRVRLSIWAIKFGTRLVVARAAVVSEIYQTKYSSMSLCLDEFPKTQWREVTDQDQ
jgi:hypothetical protein